MHSQRPLGRQRSCWITQRFALHKHCSHGFALHFFTLELIGQVLFQGGSRRAWPLSFLCPLRPGRVASRVHLSTSHRTDLCLVLPPPPPQCIVTPCCIWLPTGRMHGKPEPLAAVRPTALLRVLGQWSPAPPRLLSNPDQPL